MRYCIISHISHFWPPGFWLIPALYIEFPSLYADIGNIYSFVPPAQMLGMGGSPRTQFNEKAHFAMWIISSLTSL